MQILVVEDEAKVARALEKGLTAEQVDKVMEKKEVDPLAILMGDLDVPTGKEVDDATAIMPSLFSSDFDYLSKGLQYIGRQQKIHRLGLAGDDASVYRNQGRFWTRGSEINGEDERRLVHACPEHSPMSGRLALERPEPMVAMP